jgi:ferrochelatase
VAMVRDLLLERAAVERGADVRRPSVGSMGPSWDRCPVGCCPNPRGPKPALCGQA